MLGDDVADECHVIGEPGQISEEQRQLTDAEAPVTDRVGGDEEHDGDGDGRHVAVDATQDLGEHRVGERRFVTSLVQTMQTGPAPTAPLRPA